jgi:hypothetical protein
MHLRHSGTVLAPECRCFGLSSSADDALLLSRFCCRPFRSRFDESSYGLRLRHVDGVASLHLDKSCACPLGHSSLSIRWNHLVFSSKQLPAWLRFPCRFADRAVECVQAPWDLGIGHECGRLWLHVCGKGCRKLRAVEQQKSILRRQNRWHRSAWRWVLDQRRH